MFHLHDTTVILPLFVHLVFPQNRFDCCVVLTFVVGVGYSYIEKGVLPISPETTSSDVETCTVLEVCGFRISLLVGYSLK